MSKETLSGADLVRQYIPDVSDGEAGWILWNRTAFPFGNLNYIRDQLRELANVMQRCPGARLCEDCANVVIGDDSLCMACAVWLRPPPLMLTACSGEVSQPSPGKEAGE